MTAAILDTWPQVKIDRYVLVMEAVAEYQVKSAELERQKAEIAARHK